jgi:hypothetical protein
MLAPMYSSFSLDGVFSEPSSSYENKKLQQTVLTPISPAHEEAKADALYFFTGDSENHDHSAASTILADHKAPHAQSPIHSLATMLSAKTTPELRPSTPLLVSERVTPPVRSLLRAFPRLSASRRSEDGDDGKVISNGQTLRIRRRPEDGSPRAVHGAAQSPAGVPGGAFTLRANKSTSSTSSLKASPVALALKNNSSQILSTAQIISRPPTSERQVIFP